MLLLELREKARVYFGRVTDEAFLDWLDQVQAEDVSNEAGMGATDGFSRLADTVDDIRRLRHERARGIELLDDELDGAAAEAKLVSLWQKTFTVAAAAQEAWLEQAAGAARLRDRRDHLPRRRRAQTALSV